MSEPIRELRQNQKDIYVTLDNHTAMMQEMSTTLDHHTEMLTALQTDVASIKATQEQILKLLQQKSGD
jgi:hypothetical protein